MRVRHFWLLVSCILVMAAVVRFAAVVVVGSISADGEFVFGDSYSYWILATQLLEGETYEYAQSRIFRTPGYPAFLAAVQWLSGSESAGIQTARILGSVLGVFTVAGVMILAAQLYDERVVLWSGVFAALYPGAIGMSVFILSEALFCPLMIGQLIAWGAASSSARPGHAWGFSAGSGALGGLAILARPSWLFFLPFAAGAALLFSANRRRELALCALSLACLALVLSPWWYRNYQLAGRFIPTTLQVGASLYDGWSPSATGASDMRFVERFREEQRRADTTSEQPPPGLFEDRLDARLKQAAVSWAVENPAPVFQLALVKFGRMWTPWPNAAEFQSASFRWIICLGYVPLVGLGLAGLPSVWRRGWPTLLCLMPALYFTCLHLIFVSSIRYRQPAMLPLIVVASVGLVGWIFRPPPTSPP